MRYHTIWNGPGVSANLRGKDIQDIQGRPGEPPDPYEDNRRMPEGEVRAHGAGDGQDGCFR